ncbi:hypothetical protein pipiens_004681 [Culex pipiens pipiens]|uniref:Major facilitator superfamily (MFS) profile domain-containing protein n=1 Tax=Culex pipiens pipiens TaxID=38569 RepID=A0ABD1CG34_CULPP
MVFKQAIQDRKFLEDHATRNPIAPLFRQIFAATGPIITSAAGGMTVGFSAILLPQLQKPDSPIQIDSEQSSWIASMAPLLMTAGCLVDGLLMERFDRKVTQLVLNVTFAAGFCLLSMASSYELILAGRFMTGFASGLVGQLTSVYIAETSDPKYRGILSAGFSFAVSFGVLISHLFGTFLHWKIAALCCSFFMVVSYVFVVFRPESPPRLISKGRSSEAEEAFSWLRGDDTEAIKEFNDMVSEYSIGDSLKTKPTFLQNLSKPEFYRPLTILLIFFFVSQFAGVHIVSFYSVSIIHSILGSNMNEYLAMIIVDIVRVIASLIPCVLLKVTRRRPLAMWSGCGTTISLAGLSIFLHFRIPQQLTWISLVFLLSYIVFINIGLFPLPWCMAGETFPQVTREIGSAMTTSFNFLSFFVVIKTGPLLFDSVGTDGAFMIYGGISLVGTLVLYAILPETKDRTLQEIEDAFKLRWRTIEGDDASGQQVEA